MAQTAIAEEQVDDVLADFRERGRAHVKARDIAQALGLPATTSVHSTIGHRLKDLADADDPPVEKWNEPVSGAATWRLTEAVDV